MSSVKKRAVLLFFTLGIILTMFSTAVILLPDEINLKEGSTKQYSFNIPAEAAITNNDKSISEVSVDKAGNIILNGEKSGKASLKLSVMGIPLKDVKVSVIPDIRLVPSGETIGIRINTDGIMVLGIGEVSGNDNKNYMPCAGKLKSGDLILSANGENTPTKEALIKQVEKSGGNVNLKINRDGDMITSDITAIKGSDNKYKIGIWVRDSTQGIGTVTFYNENTKDYGALGHQITDVDTNMIMSVKNGKIMNSYIKNIRKGISGTPGELMGTVDESSSVGTIEKNTECGIFGKINDSFTKSPLKAMPIALKEEIQPGKAQILCNIDKEGTKLYDINIESINKFNTNECKGMVIKVTDKRLISLTNGIVQGMSGSPIIQNDKLVGAVTHVFVKDSTKGYGIFIENMLGEIN